MATSPNGEYAFVKFSDRFELHTKDGGKTVIQETESQPKGRGKPQNLLWLNNDFMAIFSSTYGGYPGETKKPQVYLFDRKANVVEPLIQNAYLIPTSSK